MSWTERQQRMLAEMGLPPWFGSVADDHSEPVIAATPTADEKGRAPTLNRFVEAPRPKASPVAIADAAPGASKLSMSVEQAMTLDWPELRSVVANCTACGLCQGRTQTVFGVGNEAANWMVVGEAPGEQEDRKGEPFVGRSGKLLDNMLHALGLTRDEAAPDRQVYIANTLKCRPPGNRNPTAEELACCEPFLIRQLALVKPRIILAMGRFAVQSLLRSSEPVGRLRGRVHHYQGVPLVVTYHPAYLLRNPQDKARAWDDLCLAAATAEQTAAKTIATAPALPAG